MIQGCASDKALCRIGILGIYILLCRARLSNSSTSEWLGWTAVQALPPLDTLHSAFLLKLGALPPARRALLPGTSAVRKATSVLTMANCATPSRGRDAQGTLHQQPVTGRKSPGAEAESAGPKGQDPRAPPRPRAGRAPGQLAIATVMWPVGSQPTNSTGLTLALTLTPHPGTADAASLAAIYLRRCFGGARWGSSALELVRA